MGIVLLQTAVCACLCCVVCRVASVNIPSWTGNVDLITIFQPGEEELWTCCGVAVVSFLVNVRTSSQISGLRLIGFAVSQQDGKCAFVKSF